MSTREDPNRLLSRVLGPGAPELSCEECFEQLDRYVELGLADPGTQEQMPMMRAHLQGCPACREDHDSLLEYLTAQGGIDA